MKAIVDYLENSSANKKLRDYVSRKEISNEKDEKQNSAASLYDEQGTFLAEI